MIKKIFSGLLSGSILIGLFWAKTISLKLKSCHVFYKVEKRVFETGEYNEYR